MARRLDPRTAENLMRAAGLEPLEPYIRSNSPWKCRCNSCQSEVRPTLSSIRSGQTGCRACAISTAATRRRMTHDDASKIMTKHGFQPLEPYPGNQKLWLCRCIKCGNEIRLRRLTVTQSGTGCKHCWEARRGDHLRFSTERAIGIMRAAGLQPLEPYVNSETPWRSVHLACGREVLPRLNSIRQGSTGCRFCGYVKMAEARRNDSESAKELMRNSGLEPLEEYPGSHKKWLCVHVECGEVVTPTYSGVQSGESGCRSCAGRKRGLSQRLSPETAHRFMVANGLEPQEPYELSNKPWACIHVTCGSLVYPTYASIKSGQRGCRPCADRETAERTRYSTAAATQMAKSHGYEPLDEYPGAQKPWRCRHTVCGREVVVILNTLNAGKGCCTPCGIQSRAEKNRYTGAEASQVMRKHELEPLEEFPGYSIPWRCRHETCGREVSPTFWYVKFRRSGCKYCAVRGLDYESEGIIYLLKRDDYFSLKVGVTTPASRTDRIAAHVKEGWRLITTWATPTADDAENVESEVLRWWRDDLEAPVSMSKETMKSGWTETASQLFVSDVSTCSYIDRLISEILED